jgi:hypothetical protein
MMRRQITFFLTLLFFMSTALLAVEPRPTSLLSSGERKALMLAWETAQRHEKSQKIILSSLIYLSAEEWTVVLGEMTLRADETLPLPLSTGRLEALEVAADQVSFQWTCERGIKRSVTLYPGQSYEVAEDRVV